MNTYLVVPDNYSGDIDFEMLVQALTPLQACELVRDFLEAGEEIEKFRYVGDQERDGRGTTWTVRQFPDELPSQVGVVNWDDFKFTQWEAVYVP
jgi:hypothetical protein